MKLLIVDCETSGLDPAVDSITELAMLVYETDNNRILEARSFLIYNEKLELSPFIKELTGLTESNLLAGISKEEAAVLFMGYLSTVDYLVAHNAEFDLSFLEVLVGAKINTPVIDTRVDLPLDYTPRSFSLASLCNDHELLNHFAHCSLGDTLMVAKLIEQYDINEIIKKSKDPTITIQAIVSFKDKDLAKERGFHWTPEEKLWTTKVKQSTYSSGNYDFKTKIIGG